MPAFRDNLTVRSDTKIEAWSSSESKPDDHALQAETERQAHEPAGVGRGMLAMIGKTAAGFIWWYDQPALVRSIRQVATRTPYRGRGVASRVPAACVQTAYQSGMIAVIISVDAENDRALRLYSKLGFPHAVYDLDTYLFGKSTKTSTHQSLAD